MSGVSTGLVSGGVCECVCVCVWEGVGGQREEVYRALT